MDASAVTVYPIDDIPMGNLQDILGTIYGKAKFAADGVGSAIYKAEQAQAKADTVEGTAQYAANTAGWLEFHVRQIAGLVGYAVPPNPNA